MIPDLTYGASRIDTNYATGQQTVRYRQVTHTVRRSGKCPMCGKRRTRQTTLMATVNPFNVDPATGHPRTAAQVYRALVEDGEAWSPTFLCEGTHKAEEGQ